MLTSVNVVTVYDDEWCDAGEDGDKDREALA